MSTSILASYFILISKHKQLQVSQSGTWQVQAQSHLEQEAGEQDSARNGPTAGRRQSHISPSLMHCSHTERPAQHSQHSKEQ